MSAYGCDHVRSCRVFLYHAPIGDRVFPCPVGSCQESVELLLKGIVLFPVDGTDLPCGHGSLFWHRSGEETIHRSDPDDPYACMAVRFELERDVPRQVSRLLHLPESIDRDRFCDEVLTHFHRGGYDRRLFAQQLYARLLWYAHLAERTEPDPLLPPVLRSVLEQIDLSFTRDLLIAELARRAGCSAAHLHLLFKRHLGTTPHRYILTRRLDQARHLLATSAIPIAEISRQVGFGDPASFSRRFRTAVGHTPSAYRRQHALHFIR
ncbi:MAG: helix-turn-helix domain-containing protein [Planctomycetota bacterium]